MGYRFTNTLPAHVMIEMCFGKKREWGFIAEDNMHPKRLEALLESYGVFRGCEDIAGLISAKIGKQHITGDIKNFCLNIENCPFIENICLIWNKDKGGKYDTNSNINNSGKFDPLILELSLSEIGGNNVMALIMHELTHAYEDYKRRSSNRESLHSLAKKIGYQKKDDEIQNTDLAKIISEVFYFLQDFERNAYIAQMSKLLDDCTNEFSSAKSALEWIKTTFPYRSYVKIFKYCQELCHIVEPQKQEIVLTFANKLSNQEFKTYASFVYWLSKKAYRCQRKIDRMVSIMAANKLNIREGFRYANAPLYYENDITLEEALERWEKL